MPTYEYVCEKCGQKFEKFQLMAAKALTICPEDRCGQKKWGKGKVKKMISAGAGLIFKGSGFYITDYRSDKYKEAAKQDSSAPTAPAGDSKTSGGEAKPGKESKPAASEPKPSAVESKSSSSSDSGGQRKTAPDKSEKPSKASRPKD